MLEEAQPRNITRADLVLTEGFGLEVDGRMKTVFPTLQAAEKKARAVKAEFPMLQIKVYDAAEKTRTLVELPPAKAIPSKKETRTGEIGDRDGRYGSSAVLKSPRDHAIFWCSR
jgi:hypothetical protein